MRRWFDVEHGRLLDRRAQGVQQALDKRAAPGVLRRRRVLRIAEGMVETPAAHDAVGADARCDGVKTGGQGGGNALAFAGFGDRSTATRAGASRRRQHDGADAALLQGGGHFGADFLHGAEAGKIADGDQQVVQQPADDPLSL